MGLAIWLHCFGLALAGAYEDLSLLQLSVATDQDAAPSEEEYYWSSRGRTPQTSSFASYTAPTDFSAGPTWVWQNEFKEQVRHSPLIDTDKSIYVTTTTRVRKFDSDGHLLWTWHAAPYQSISASPALYKGHVYVLPCDFLERPTAVSIDMNTGKVTWQRTYDDIAHGAEAAAILVDRDTLWFGAHTPDNAGTDTVVAASASDGRVMWQYVTDETMWNFSPSTPGDGSLLFSSTCGAVFRISSEGKLMWKAGTSHPHKQCVPAGGALGPNGMFYSEYNEGDGPNGFSGVNNTLAAYNIEDGSLVWKRNLPYRAAQYPAIGKLGRDGPLAVVAALGDNPVPPIPPELNFAMLAKLGGPTRNIVVAFDAGTGEPLWETEEEPFPSFVAAGELDEHNATDGSACWPDAQGIPLISGDGTVYTSSSHHGDLRAVKDFNNDGVISPSEVSTFKTGKCFLNSPSMAPGMLVAAPCWGPMYVFKK